VSEYSHIREAGAHRGRLARLLLRLSIYHDGRASRLTPAYRRRWCRWGGASLGRRMSAHSPEVPLLAGAAPLTARGPVVGAGRAPFGSIRLRDSAASFGAKLAFWDLLGLFYRRHFWSLAKNVRGRASYPLSGRCCDARFA
jgi:hypothetical protein